MVRKQSGAASELASVDPEPKGAESPASSPPSAPDKPADPKRSPSHDEAGSVAVKVASGTSEKDSDAASSPKPDSAPAESGEQAEGEDRPPPPPRPKPERRVSAFTSNFNELKAAFPEEKEGVLRAVLVAASNNLEDAFTGMLAMTDPTIRPTVYINEQIERDARLARRLAATEAERPRRERRRDHRVRDQPRHLTQANFNGSDPANDYGGDDIYDGFQRGFTDTKQAVSSFWGSLKQRLSNELDDGDDLDMPEGREPPRSQWWPRQSDPDSSTPPLPPRKPSRASTGRLAESKEPRSVNAFGDELGAPRKQWEPVQADIPEPDAFFIGESDDDDLGSLNDESPLREAGKDAAKESKPENKEAAKQPAKESAKEPAKEPAKDSSENTVKDASKDEPKKDLDKEVKEDAEGKEKDSKEDSKEDVSEDSESARGRRASTAKDLLTKLRQEAGEKAKAEEDKS